MTPATANAPVFRVHSSYAAFARGLWVAALCAALTAGFLSQVWRGPSGAESGAASPAAACAEGTQGHAC
jgi:hypothetical protein